MTTRKTSFATISILVAAALLSGCMGGKKEAPKASEGIPLANYLAKGKELMVGNYCTSPQSPFMKSGNPQKCSQQVTNLFDFCTNKELKGILVPTISTEAQANAVARIVDDCVKAHNAGGAQVETFRAKLKSAFEQKNPAPANDATKA